MNVWLLVLQEWSLVGLHAHAILLIITIQTQIYVSFVQVLTLIAALALLMQLILKEIVMLAQLEMFLLINDFVSYAEMVRSILLKLVMTEM